MTAEVSLLSQEVAKLSEENTKRTLELQKEETQIRMEESKRNNDVAMQLLEEFTKKDPTDACVEKTKKIESLRDDLGDELINSKLEKLKNDYLSENEI